MWKASIATALYSPSSDVPIKLQITIIILSDVPEGAANLAAKARLLRGNWLLFASFPLPMDAIVPFGPS